MWAIRPKPQLSLNSSGWYRPAFIDILTRQTCTKSSTYHARRSMRQLCAGKREVIVHIHPGGHKSAWRSLARLCRLAEGNDWRAMLATRQSASEPWARRPGSQLLHFLAHAGNAARPRFGRLSLGRQRLDRRLGGGMAGKTAIGHHIQRLTLQ